MAFFNAVPAWLTMLLIPVSFAALACSGHILVHRSFRKTDFLAHNDVAGFIIAVAGAFYAVLLAFVIVIVWDHFNQAEDRSTQEVDAATDVWRIAAHPDVAGSTQIARDLKQYVGDLLSDEWPAMQRGENSRIAQRDIVALLDDVVDQRIVTLRDANLQNNLLQRVQTMADLRRRRINDNTSGVPPVLWMALLGGAATIVGFVYLFGLVNFRAQLLMTAATAILMGLSFGVMVKLDFPFRGDVSISPERWLALDKEIVVPQHISKPARARSLPEPALLRGH